MSGERHDDAQDAQPPPSSHHKRQHSCASQPEAISSNKDRSSQFASQGFDTGPRILKCMGLRASIPRCTCGGGSSLCNYQTPPNACLYKIILTSLSQPKLRFDKPTKGKRHFDINARPSLRGVVSISPCPKSRKRGQCTPLPWPNAVVIIPSTLSHLSITAPESGVSCLLHLSPMVSPLLPVAPLLPLALLAVPLLLATTLA